MATLLLYGFACVAYSLYSIGVALEGGSLGRLFGSLLAAAALAWTAWALWRRRPKANAAAMAISIGLCAVSAARGWLLIQGGEPTRANAAISLAIALLFAVAAARIVATRLMRPNSSLERP